MDKELLDAFLYIDKNKIDYDLLLCLPINYSYAATYFTGCKILQSSESSAEGIKYNSQFFEQLKKDDLSEVIMTYNVRWLITVDKEVDVRVDSILAFNEKYVKVYKIL
jgi:hypothetical protein